MYRNCWNPGLGRGFCRLSFGRGGGRLRCGGRGCGRGRSRRGHRNRGLVVGSGGGSKSHRSGSWSGRIRGSLGYHGRGLRRRDISSNMLDYVRLLVLMVLECGRFAIVTEQSHVNFVGGSNHWCQPPGNIHLTKARRTIILARKEAFADTQRRDM